MIWLSPMTGTEEGSVYFEIRDIALQSNETGSSGLIRGLLGDGQSEIWAEVTLGRNPQVQILPLWSDNGQVVSLSAEVDEELLKVQLLQSVTEVFSSFSNRSMGILPVTGRNISAKEFPARQPNAA